MKPVDGSYQAATKVGAAVKAGNLMG